DRLDAAVAGEPAQLFHHVLGREDDSLQIDHPDSVAKARESVLLLRTQREVNQRADADQEQGKRSSTEQDPEEHAGARLVGHGMGKFSRREPTAHGVELRAWDQWKIDAKKAPNLLKNPCDSLAVCELCLAACFLVSGGGSTVGSSCTSLLFSSLRVAMVGLRSGMGSLPRKMNGASTARCCSGGGGGEGGAAATLSAGLTGGEGGTAANGSAVLGCAGGGGGACAT